MNNATDKALEKAADSGVEWWAIIHQTLDDLLNLFDDWPVSVRLEDLEHMVLLRERTNEVLIQMKGSIVRSAKKGAQ